MIADYRSRIYDQYMSGRDLPPAPENLEGLRPRRPQTVKLISDHFSVDRDSRILDLGCGYGAIIHFARQAGYRNLVGIDRSAEQVEMARQLGIEGVEQGDVMESLQRLPVESQDVVIAFDLIEHFTKGELLALVDEVRRVLKPGGRWIINAPNGESPFHSRICYGDFTHELSFTSTSIGQLLHSSGFSEVYYFEDSPVPHGLKSAIRWALWKLIRSGLRLYLAVEVGVTNGVFTQNFLVVAFKQDNP